MPGGMSGFELAQKLRERCPDLRFHRWGGGVGANAIPGLLILRKQYSNLELAGARKSIAA